MERTMSVEEKIKKAEEIYARRHGNENRNSTTLYLHGKEKKDIKLFKKLIFQIIICLLIYLVFYVIQHSNYIFSKDFISKTKEVLSYDTNFSDIYKNVKSMVKGLFVTQEEPKKENESIGGSDEESKKEEIKEQEKKEINDKKETNKQNNKVELTEEEKQIEQIKKTTSFVKPIEGTISSKYGLRNPSTSAVPKNHTGTDIAANLGTKIISSTDGEVVISSSEGDYGNHLKIQIGDVSIIYAHCNKLYVKQGDKVKQGQEIAEVGSTGNSTGPHLHFEIRYKENTIDPEKILKL